MARNEAGSAISAVAAGSWREVRASTEVQSELYMAMDQHYITKAEFHDVYDHAGRTRATIRGFTKYLLSYEQSRQKQP